MFSMERTGSNMLTSVLSTHPEIMCFPAIFSRKEWPSATDDKSQKLESVRRLSTLNPRWEDQAKRTENIAQLLTELDCLATDRTIWGFKFQMVALSRRRTRKVLEVVPTAIELSRDNVLASFSSHLIAKATGQGLAFKGDRIRTAQISFERVEFENFWQDRVYIRDNSLIEIRGHSERLMQISYTDVCTSSGLEAIASFLHVSPRGFGDYPTSKRNSANIADRFVNSDEVRTYLKVIERPEWEREF